MNINFGIIPPLDHFVKGKRNKNAEISQRALEILEMKKADILASAKRKCFGHWTERVPLKGGSNENYHRRHGRRQRA